MELDNVEMELKLARREKAIRQKMKTFLSAFLYTQKGSQSLPDAIMFLANIQ